MRFLQGTLNKRPSIRNPVLDDLLKGDVARDDSQRRLLAQQSVAMLEQCCNDSKQCRNNVATQCAGLKIIVANCPV